MKYLIVYDICDPRRLNRVARILKDYGSRVQKSKFEAELSDVLLRQLMDRIREEIDPDEDGVKYIPLCGKCRCTTELIGQGRLVDPDKEFYIY